MNMNINYTDYKYTLYYQNNCQKSVETIKTWQKFKYIMLCLTTLDTDTDTNIFEEILCKKFDPEFTPKIIITNKSNSNSYKLEYPVTIKKMLLCIN